MNLFSYRKVDDYLLDNFAKNQIYLNMVSAVNDPYEGSFAIEVDNSLKDDFYSLVHDRVEMPDEMVETINEMEDEEQKFNLYYRIFEGTAKKASNQNVGIYCLTTNKNSLPMWAHYANRHKGVMIEFNVSNSVFEKAIPITYIDSINVVKIRKKNEFTKLESILYDSLGVKHSSWSYENEYRIKGRANSFLKYPSETIKAIYFGMYCTENDKIRVKLANSHNPNIEYYQSVVMTGMYEVHYS